MTSYFLKFISLLLIATTSFLGIPQGNAGELPSKENALPKVYVLRAPRSGSHWFFYCNNVLFEKNIYTESSLMTEFPYKKNGESIFTAHNPYDLYLTDNSYCKDYLILLIRNYRECMVRNYHCPDIVKNEILYQASFNPLSQEKNWVFNLRMNHYFHNLRIYDLWCSKKRLIIYYEDLIENPQETLLQVAKFIGENKKEDAIQEFINNLDTHINNSLAIYERTHQSHTRGKSLLYHTHKIGMEKSREIDELVIKYFPDFTEKYLSRYLLKLSE